jgi:hypothetical protein
MAHLKPPNYTIQPVTLGWDMTHTSEFCMRNIIKKERPQETAKGTSF